MADSLIQNDNTPESGLGQSPNPGSGSRRGLLVAFILLVAVALLAAIIFWLATNKPQGSVTDTTGKTAVCDVKTATPQFEETVYVDSASAASKAAEGLSYTGPCAEYGGSGEMGQGSFTTYTQFDGDKPLTVGVLAPAKTFTGLPTDPPNEGLYCADKNQDGTTDRATECSGGYERQITLGHKATQNKDLPFTYSLINWNPTGHVPPGVYNVPHFDIHFYMDFTNAERLAIRAGTCDILVNCDDVKKLTNLPDKKYLPEGYTIQAPEPAMGNHMIDAEGHEWHQSDSFTHSFIYGVSDKEIIYYEPMVTLKWFTDLIAGTTENQCFDIKKPAAWQKTGYYPTKYCLDYVKNRDEVRAYLSDFVLRQAS